MDVKCTCAMQKQNVLILLHCFYFDFTLVSTSLLRYLFDCTVLHFTEIHNMLLIYLTAEKKKEVYVIL